MKSIASYLRYAIPQVERAIDVNCFGALFIAVLALSVVQGRAQVTDHAGQDWSPVANQQISGEHINIGRFYLPAGVTNYVIPWDGANYGSITIRARIIDVAGTIQASGCGYKGGSGGGGGGGADDASPGAGGAAGAAPVGSIGTAGGVGHAVVGGNGGHGGTGQGPFPGTGGIGGAGAGSSTNGNTARGGNGGNPGGYAALDSNGDSTMGEELWMGSGGGGAGGGGGGHSFECNSGGGGGQGGSAGGPGGGIIRLYATESCTVSGALWAMGGVGGRTSKGQDGQPYLGAIDNGIAGRGSAGGVPYNGPMQPTSSSDCGYCGGAWAIDQQGAYRGKYSGAGGGAWEDGGFGGGGGILISAPFLTLTGTVVNVSYGGLGHGTLKVFYQTAASSMVTNNIATGRLLVQRPCSQVSILSAPAPQTVQEGSNAVFHASGAGIDYRYQWLFNGNPIPNATNSDLNLTGLVGSQAGSYQARIFNYCSSQDSSPALLIVTGRSQVSGFVWNDLNANGRYDTNIIVGGTPDIVFVVDVSGSTSLAFQGSPVGDINGDGSPNDVLDGELAGFIALARNLRDNGYAATARVSIIAFADLAVKADMSPATSGFQLTSYLGDDLDNDGVMDVEQVLKTIVRDYQGAGSGTSYKAALASALDAFNQLSSPGRSKNLVFISDGEPNALDYDIEAAALRALPANLRAFGAGAGAQPGPLQRIDPSAQIFQTTDELIALFGSVSGRFPELPLAGVRVFVDANQNGSWDAGEPTTMSGTDGTFFIGGLLSGSNQVRSTVPAGYVRTAPTNGLRNLSLGVGQNLAAQDFGLRQTTPLIAITSPTTNSTYMSYSTPLSLSGIVWDDVVISQISWVNDRGGGGNVSGTNAWNISGINLANGLNNITVTATDTSANSVSASVQITFQAAILGYQRLGSGIQLTWANPSYLLESSQNLNGPWLIVSSNSPYSALTMSDQQRFFRLRKAP